MQLGERKLLNGFCTYLHKSSVVVVVVVVTITIIIIIIAVIVVQLTSIGH